MFTIECYTKSFYVHPITHQLFLSGEPPEKVGVVCFGEDEGVIVGEENTIIFNSGCEAIHALGDLAGDGEDLVYVCKRYRASNP